MISFATIFGSIAAIGIPGGVQRFLGKGFSRNDLQSVRHYIKNSLMWISIGVGASAVAILAVHSRIGAISQIDFPLIVVAVVYVAFTSFSTFLRSVVISSLKTAVLPAVMIGSTAVKLGLAIALVGIGLGPLGVTLGFTSFAVISTAILALSILPMISGKAGMHEEATLRLSSKELLSSSVAGWIPSVVSTVGAHLGPIAVFGASGAADAGVYFMAFAIILSVSAIPQVLFSIAVPILSRMDDGRKRFMWQATKMSLLLALPLSSALMFYSQDIMGLFGVQYESGSMSLRILLASMTPIALITAVSSLAYVYGKYRQMLGIGMAFSIPRALLYPILLSVFGSIGAAVSYTIGSMVGLIVSLIIAKKIGMLMSWKDIAAITALPSLVGYAVSLTGINFILGILASMLASYASLAIVRSLTQDDIRYIISLLPHRLSNRIIVIMDIIDRPKRFH